MVRSNDFGAVHSGLRGPHGLLRGDQREVSIGGGHRDFELRALRGGFGLRLARASAAATLAWRRPKSNGSQVTSTPTALPQAVPKLLVPSTGPDIDGITLCGSSRPKTLFRVARLTCASASTRGR